MRVTAVTTWFPTQAAPSRGAFVVRDLQAIAAHAEVRLVLQPAWTTDWMTDEGKAKLNEYGIAPPVARTTDGPIRIGMAVKCPRCHSLNTREITRFGSTSCKALYTCRECLEPFDYFKVH